MKRKSWKLTVLCMVMGLTAGFIAVSAKAQDATNQKPQLLIRIRNFDKSLNDVEKLISSIRGTSAGPSPTAALRTMLQGGDWIDPQRSVVIGVVLKDPKPKVVALVPFRTANPAFQAMSSAVAGDNYYLAAIPPEPGFSSDPATREALLKASNEASEGSIVVEAAMSAILDQVEPQLEAAMKKMEASPRPQTGPSTISQKEAMEMLSGMLKILRQAETVRYGLDISGDVFTLLFDIDALPNTPLSDILIDPHADSRLMSYPIDMPLQIRSRSHDMAGIPNLIGPGLGSFYRRMGIDFDKMSELIKYFTGEFAGGVKISSDGVAAEFIYILRPGIDGDSFISNTYLPWLENYGLQMSSFISKQTGKPPEKIYERTADSTVAGVKVRGVKTNFNALVPSGEQQTGIFNNRPMEMRIAALDDMLFGATSDAKLEALINRSRNLKKSPAQGPIMRVDLEIGAFAKDIQTLFPSAGTAVVWPDNLGNLTMVAEMNNGKLATRTSFNIDVLRRLSEAFQALAKKQALAASRTGGENSAH